MVPTFGQRARQGLAQHEQVSGAIALVTRNRIAPVVPASGERYRSEFPIIPDIIKTP